MDEPAFEFGDDERVVIARYLTTIAELSERHADRLDALLRERQHGAIGERLPGGRQDIATRPARTPGRARRSDRDVVVSERQRAT